MTSQYSLRNVPQHDRRRDPSLAAPIADQAGWTPLDARAVDTARLLAADAVQRTGNGHPGTAMSLAPLAHLLFQQVLRHDPDDDQWLGRDRFVLSCGHSSLTQYIQLYLTGYGLELSDLEALRTWGSATPGHPEYRHTRGIEITTGPLGQGLASAVGMAMAARRERGLLDPDAAPGRSPFDHRVYVLASDGDMMEGVSSEASSLAGHQRLGDLIVFYDQNHISIEDDTDIAFSEDVGARYRAYGWHVEEVDWTRTGKYVEDLDAVLAAVRAAEAETSRPSMIVLRTIIGWPAPTKQNTGKAHGAALGEEEVAATKELLGFDPGQDFAVGEDVLAHTRGAARERGRRLHQLWEREYQQWRKNNPERAALLDRLRAAELPDGWADAIPFFSPDPKGMATRKASGEVLTALAPVLPELWGGSADLAGSNNTTMEGEPSFIPSDRQTKEWKGGPYGRTLHFGVREHAMGAILNGIALQSLTRAYGGTFLTFSDYMRPAVRLGALMKLPAIYVWTHDSIGLGEDGPTHQPVEHLAALRAIPGLDVVRPGDANETAVCWRTVIEHRDRPTGMVLTRQNLPVLARGEGGCAPAEGAARGGYVLSDAGTADRPDVLLIGTGSEVQIALDAAALLGGEGIAARVVSMPCQEWFAAQPEAYRDDVLPPAVRARVSVEAAVGQGWRDIVGDAGRIVSLEHFGASADYKTLYREFGITPEAVAQAARDSLAAARSR
ncbi:transketolase [Actinacidiphila oryziradicis]|uniref:Transketolase n=1 Tax=Actinacidiphila oryziradicis TaxID=2571141 RepID=A0A4U0SBT3_9ACTN|nr:transketolase [Actinacidiphila oryziradicis]TKA06692.1 transketolase [Actinacidiphila oryziradicis]